MEVAFLSLLGLIKLVDVYKIILSMTTMLIFHLQIAGLLDHG